MARDFQKQRLYDFEDRTFYRSDEACFGTLKGVQDFVDSIWTSLDLDIVRKPTVKWLRKGAGGSGKFIRNNQTEKTILKFNRNCYFQKPLNISIVLHELAHAIDYAKFSDGFSAMNHGEVFTRILLELQSVLNVPCSNGLYIDSLIALARADGLKVWEFKTLKWHNNITVVSASGEEKSEIGVNI